MGVRGLTGYIARRADLYLTPYELHDCNLVIDGDNLACNLYKDIAGHYSAFGGDYDDFYRAVKNFFSVLAECNIKAYVLMDGGYEHRKLRTVGKRMIGKICILKRINPCASITVFPLMMKEVFVDAVKDCGVPVMRCVFEADDELAALGRKLKCPVLSYDSDFYIHNVKYIPLITLTVKAHTKLCKNITSENEGEENRKLRKNEVQKVNKRTIGNRIMDKIVVDNKEKQKKGNSYKYLDCCIYRIENLIRTGSLSKEKLPLFAAMLGNDYISRSAFRNFFQSGMGKVGRSRKTSQQQRRIKVILKWLKTQTAETALEKILSRLQIKQRKSLMDQFAAATSGYSNEKCRSYEYFKNHGSIFEEFPETDDEEFEESEEVDEEESDIEEEDDDDEVDNDEEGSSEVDIEENEENSEGLENKTEKSEEDLKVDREFNNDVSEDMKNVESENNECDIISSFPKWFTQKLYPANLPRFFVDLMYLRKYINNPQIEHFIYDDCNAIALPILTFIYSLLHNVKGEECCPNEIKNGDNRTLFFTYLTRNAGRTKICYKRIEVEEELNYDFLTNMPNTVIFRKVFENNMPEINIEELFIDLHKLPDDLRVYFLAIVYWLQTSQHYDVVHLHSLLICLVVLRIIDTKITPERDVKIFQKKFGKIIKKERQVRDKEEENGNKRVIKDEVRAIPIPDRLAYIPKSDCYLVLNDILKHFHMQDIFKKKYDLYSSIVLHAFAEFQSVVFQLHSLNALLDFPYACTRMGQLYCGVFLYNLYDLLKWRIDVEYYVKSFIFRDSDLMFEFYAYLWKWCEKFIPASKKCTDQKMNSVLAKRISKKKRQQARKDAAKENTAEDPNADMLSSGGEINDAFIDLNNKFCNFLSIR